MKNQMRQRKRTNIGTIQNVFKHWNCFLFPRNLYSLLIFPSHKTLAMFSPFILLAILILYITALDIKIVIRHLVLTLLIFAGMFALLMSLRGEGTKSGFSTSVIPKIIYYVLLNEYLILLAWKDFIFKRYSILWKKVDSTR